MELYRQTIIGIVREWHKTLPDISYLAELKESGRKKIKEYSNLSESEIFSHYHDTYNLLEYLKILTMLGLSANSVEKIANPNYALIKFELLREIKRTSDDKFTSFYTKGYFKPMLLEWLNKMWL